jgi:hypothetical protein
MSINPNDIVVPKSDLVSTMKKIPGNGHWKFPEQLGGLEYSGFVYVIRDNVLKRFYLGKKNYWTKIRGTTRTKMSDWKFYKSSSSTIETIFQHRPLEEFEFIVIEQYQKKGAVSYAETWSLCHVEAPTTDVWYNKRIEEIKWNVSEKITDRHKERLQRVIELETFEE